MNTDNDTEICLQDKLAELESRIYALEQLLKCTSANLSTDRGLNLLNHKPVKWHEYEPPYLGFPVGGTD